MNGENNSSHWRSFLQFNIGHLLIIIGMLTSAVWWFITYDREFTVTKFTVSSLADTVKTLAGKVDSMDVNGTRFSQKGIDKELDFLKQTAERVTKLEQINVEILPRIEKMDYNLQGVSDWVKTQKEKK
jgi:hypothetical protein